jgi:hypothetical protein
VIRLAFIAAVCGLAWAAAADDALTSAAFGLGAGAMAFALVRETLSPSPDKGNR